MKGIKKIHINKRPVKILSGDGKIRFGKGNYSLDEAVSRFFYSTDVPSSFQKPRG